MPTWRPSRSRRSRVSSSPTEEAGVPRAARTPGVRAYEHDGALRWTLFEGEDAAAAVHGQWVYVHRHVGSNRPERVDVVDPATGAILASRELPNGQAAPRLYVRNADTG